MKYHISVNEKTHFEQTAVETVKCADLSTSPDYLLAVKGNCFVKVVPSAVETSPSGSAVLVAGTKAVAYPTLTATDRVLVAVTTPAGTRGYLSVTKNAGVGFTINSTSNTETSTVDWVINS
jgi:hypothetical protein